MIRSNPLGQKRTGEDQERTIPDSNISDLVSDAMRSRKGFNPTGSKEFFQALSEMNVPKDLVRNQDRWKQVGETSDVKTFTTARSTTESIGRIQSLLRSYNEKGKPKQWLKY